MALKTKKKSTKKGSAKKGSTRERSTTIFRVDAMASLHRSERYPEGVRSAYQFGEMCGIDSPTVYSHAYYGDMSKIGEITIKRICDGFNCSPGDWIITRPELLEPEGRELRRARRALGLSQEEFADAFSERVGFQFDAVAVEA